MAIFRYLYIGMLRKYNFLGRDASPISPGIYAHGPLCWAIASFAGCVNTQLTPMMIVIYQHRLAVTFGFTTATVTRTYISLVQGAKMFPYFGPLGPCLFRLRYTFSDPSRFNKDRYLCLPHWAWYQRVPNLPFVAVGNHKLRHGHAGSLTTTNKS